MNLIEYDLSSNGQGANRYGFSLDLKKKLGVNRYYKPLADWDHGWTYIQTPNIDYYKVLISNKLNFVVSNKEKASNLREYTSNKVSLAPLPFYYYYNNILTQRLRINNKDRLLIMPAKTLNFANLNNKTFIQYQKTFIENIIEAKKEFKEIAICIHNNDIKIWDNIIGKNKVTIIRGADPIDNNSYKRMYQIFSNFEYMITNYFGSHIVYAASMGIKVSLNSQLIDYKIDENKIKNFYSKFKKVDVKGITSDYYDLFNTKEIKKKLHFLFFENPKNAKILSDWAKKEIGHNYEASLVDAKNLLGFNFKDQLKFGIKKFI